MKRFDLATEVPKQLITIASAIITVVIAFYEKFFSHADFTFAAMFITLFIFIISVGLGVLSIGGVTTLVENQERTPGIFVELRRSYAQKFAVAQQIVFIFGLVAFLFVALIDRLYELGPAKGIASAHTKIPMPLVWAQLRPDEGDRRGQLIARAIVSPEDSCPDATFEGQGFWNGKIWPMATRWTGTAGAFPIKVCEIAYPGYLSAKVGQVYLQPRPTDPKTIVVIGDTGCRLTAGPNAQIQNCDSLQEWPFHLVAATARIHKPDLIIHLGDYHYREAPCPDSAGCAGSPYGDNWQTWLKDFFEPAQAMLPSAPWVMVRGNHEGWTRAGPGFQLLLSPWPRALIDDPWADESPPYQLIFQELTMTVVDVANSGDDTARRGGKYAGWFKSILAAAGTSRENWLLMHKPLWVHVGCGMGIKYASCPAAPLRVAKPDPIDNIRQLFKSAPTTTLSLVLSGDTHVFEMFAPDDAHAPVQLVAGMSGTALEDKKAFDPVPQDQPLAETLSDVAGKLWVEHRFGYLVLDKDASGWIVTLYGVDGSSKLRCKLNIASIVPGEEACTTLVRS